MQGVLSAKVVLVMYGDYQCSRSADVYKLIKGIKQELSAFLRGLFMLYLPSFSAKHIHPHAQRQPKLLKPLLSRDSFGRCTTLYLSINNS